MKSAVTTPLDVKLMNMTATVLFVVFVGLCVVATVRWIAHLAWFDIKAIYVSGQVSHNNALTLRANIAPKLGGTFLSVDLANVRAAFQAAPWVRNAVVHRQFPDRLKVVLQEHQAVAYWGVEGEGRLLNNYGEVFDANVGEVEQDVLPRLNGPEPQSGEILVMYQSLAPLFGRMDMVVEQLELSDRGSWRVRLDSGAVVEMGRGSVDDLVGRSNRFLKTLTQVTTRCERQPGALESADLRHENGYAIKLRGVTTLTSDGPKKAVGSN
jgi:cell division protein FtsQ